MQHWMIGYNVGVDKGGIMNRGDAICAEDSTQPWLFWMDWTEVCEAHLREDILIFEFPFCFLL